MIVSTDNRFRTPVNKHTTNSLLRTEIRSKRKAARKDERGCHSDLSHGVRVDPDGAYRHVREVPIMFDTLHT